MVTEPEKTIEVLQTAIQMEIDGQEYYLKVSRESTNELGRKLLERLAAEEDVHRQKFIEIYNHIRQKKAWPAVDFQPNAGQKLRTIFARATEERGAEGKAPTTELEAIKTALDMENRSYDFYLSQSHSTSSATARDFLQTLAAEEREHHMILLDYYQYLLDPAAWFVKKEHPSLDG